MPRLPHHVTQRGNRRQTVFFSDDDYRAAVRAVLDWIRSGDVYQVNLSRRLDVDGVDPGTAPLLYGVLTERSGAPFSARNTCRARFARRVRNCHRCAVCR